jgi:DNA-binding transcriptional MocR family regulator
LVQIKKEKKMEGKIRLDHNERTPLHLQIKNQIREMIYQDILHEGKRLPPTRTLAKSLGVNRSTVVAAYDELIADGLVEAKVGSGTVVTGKRYTERTPFFRQPLDWSEIFNISPKTIQDSLIRDTIVISSQQGAISFAAGIPDLRLYPIQEFQKIISSLLRTKSEELYHLLPTEGYFPLMEFVSQEMIRNGKSLSPEEVLITSGSIQGLYLLSKMFLNPDDLVMVESPTFFAALQGFNSQGARVLGIPVDEEGMRVDILENLLARHHPKFIYTIPTFQNPGGFVMSIERRRKLLDLAYRYSVPIVEEDPYSRIYFEDPPPPSLYSMDKYNHVIHLSTFSKILFPGLRIGWVLASKPVIERLTWAKQHVDLSSNAIGQYALHEFCKQGLLEKHQEKIRSVYTRKKEIMTSALKKHCSSLLEWIEPKGGYYVWVKLKEGLSSRALLLELISQGVAYMTGEVFFPDGKGQEWFRLNFTYPEEAQIEEGIKKLGRALQKIRKKTKIQKQRQGFLTQPLV